MNISKKSHYYFILHATVLVWGFTGVLGKLINMPSQIIVLDRMLVAFLSLLIFWYFRIENETISNSSRCQMLFVGLITGAHWATFFEALKVSNVSVTLCCLSSCSFFVALIEPVFLKTKVKPYELFLSIFVIAGISIIFAFENKYSLGIILSIISALLAALFSVWNAVLIKENSSHSIALHNMLGGVLAMTIYLIVTGNFSLYSLMPHGLDWLYIFILGVICTAIAFLLGIEVLKKLSPFTVSITTNLEPIYGVILALLIFGENEIMSFEFYLGSLIILITILINAYLKSKE